MQKHNSLSPYSIQVVRWQEAATQLREIREQVFIREQQVPIALEWDGLDESAVHLLALDPVGKPIGCARILAGGTIGRMAVIENWRNKGVGRVILDRAIVFCKKQGWCEISLSAQTHAIPFYEQAGFVVCGEIYLDAGIAHRNMRLISNPAVPHR